MSKEDHSRKAVGLDVGTSRIVVAERVQDEYHFHSQLNAFVSVPFSEFTRGVFIKEKVPHQVAGEEMLVTGDQSEKLANMLNREIRRPMTRGLLNPAEAENLNVLKRIVGSMLEDSGHRGGKLCFSVPGPAVNGTDELTYHEAALKQALRDLGYEVSSINEGLAVVLAELEASSYTGIGISCGGGMCNICLAYLSLPVFSFSIPKAGDFIDSSAAAVTGENATRVRMAKEAEFHFNGHFADKIQQALAVYYDDVIRSAVAALKDAFARTRNVPRFERPIPLVIAGGSALPQGFRDRFEAVLKEAQLPVPLSEVRMAAEPLHTTAKGALVAALASV